MDDEQRRYHADLLESARQMKAARLRSRSRPRGRYPESRKIPIRLTLSTDVLCAFRATGPGWQARMDAALARMHGPTRTLM